MSNLEWWEEKYAEYLDECMGPLTVAGLEYEHSQVARKVDPIAFRCGANDYADAMGWDTDRDEDDQEEESDDE